MVLDNTICPAEILINDGKIVSILPGKSRTYASGEKASTDQHATFIDVRKI